MGLEVYYQQDIRNALLAAEQAHSAALMATKKKDDKFAQGYQEGYRAALTTVALAFGLIPGPDRLRQNWSDSHEIHNWHPIYLPATPRQNGKTSARKTSR